MRLLPPRRTMIVVLTVVVLLACAYAYETHSAKSALCRWALQDAALVEDELDARASRSITLAELVDKCSKNVARRERMIESIKVHDGWAYANARARYLELLSAENEFTRAESMVAIRLVAVAATQDVMHAAQQRFSRTCRDRSMTWFWAGRYQADKEARDSANSDWDAASAEWNSARDNVLVAAQAWLKKEQENRRRLSFLPRPKNVVVRLRSIVNTEQQRKKWNNKWNGGSR